MDSLEYGQAYRAANKERIQAYMRDYYLRHNGARRVRISTLGAARTSKKCKKCGEHKQREEFSVRKTGDRVGHLSAYCKSCMVKGQRERKKRDPSIYRRCEWPSKLKRLYGLTIQEYEAMLNRQDNRCAICRSDNPGGRKYVREGKPKFQVDHCHATGKIRGLLCNACNRALGLIYDNPDTALSMAAYLK